jgi:hypothetical protein
MDLKNRTSGLPRDMPLAPGPCNKDTNLTAKPVKNNVELQ